MHTIERLEAAIATVTQLGYLVRQEWLGGAGGGPCLIRGQRVLFLDLDLSVAEQLEQVHEALRLESAERAESLLAAIEAPRDQRRSA